MQEQYLVHHGILGQKWGVRRYQNKDGTLTSAGKKRYGSWSYEDTKKWYEDAKTKAKEKEKPVDHQKSKSQVGWFISSLILDVARLNPVGLGIDIVRGGQAINASIKQKKFDKEKMDDEIDKKTGFRLKSREYTEKEDLERINPSLYNFDENTKSNCMLCTSAYELRRRGYDVEANVASEGYYEEDVGRWFKNAKVSAIATTNNNALKAFSKEDVNNIITTIEKQPEGSRGNIMVNWKGMMCGHSMIYEVKDGKMIIKDGQSNKVYADPSKILKNCCFEVNYVRTDNLELNMKGIKEVCK